MQHRIDCREMLARNQDRFQFERAREFQNGLPTRIAFAALDTGDVALSFAHTLRKRGLREAQPFTLPGEPSPNMIIWLYHARIIAKKEYIGKPDS
jgi:hypothetical protein